MEGRTISHYKVLEKLGEGGMGEVYLAEDTSLKRKVALKVLPEFLQQDPISHKRFIREAQSAAALDHPYICNFHEVGRTEDGQDFIVMEYVEGETLRQTLEKGRVPLKEALRIASEIAEALEKAHSQDIVHRDLKPANIMLTVEGHAKVMDFGLAKRITSLDDQGEEITAALTREGATLGTLGYMSPEQLQGQFIDTRSDLFSFGIVLYEMITGAHPFKKGTGMGTANAIISETQAPMSLHSQEIPVLLQYVANKMLAKEPGRRYQLAHEVRTDLEQLSDSGETEAKLFQAAGVGAEETRRVWRWVVPLMLASVVFAALLGWYLKPSVVPRLNRLVVALPAGQQLPQSGSVFALSPDGTLLVYVGVSAGRRQLYLRPLNSFEVIVIEGTEGASCPFFSPDGRWVGFFADRKLKKLSLNEGLVVDLCDAAEPWGATWTPDDNIIFATGRTSPLFRVAAKGGGTPEVFSIPNREKGEYGHIWPQRVECRRAIVYEVDIPAPASDLVAIRTSVDTEGGS